MKKRIFAAVLACLMLVGLVPFSASAASETARVTTVIEPQYEDMDEFRAGYIAAKQNGKWGVLDEAGQWVIQPDYDWMGSVNEGVVLAGRNAGMDDDYADYCDMYLLDVHGMVVELYEWAVLAYWGETEPGVTAGLTLSMEYLNDNYNTLYCNEGVIVVAGHAFRRDGTYIHAKKIGETVGRIGGDFGEYYNDCRAIGLCRDGLIPMLAMLRPYAGGKPFLMDTEGNIVQVVDIPVDDPIYQYECGVWITAPENGYMIVTMTDMDYIGIDGWYNKIGTLSVDGYWLVEPQYTDYLWVPKYGTMFRDGLWVVCQNGYYGAVDETGFEVLPCIYDKVNPYFEGYSVVVQDGICRLADCSGNMTDIPGPDGGKSRVTKASRFIDGLAGAYDELSGKAYLIRKAEDGSISVVPGSDKLPMQLYFPKYVEGEALGSMRSEFRQNTPLYYRENGKWGCMMLTLTDADAPAPGTPMGDVLYTDIVAYIDDHAIRSYNIAGNTYIVVEDLAGYGFNVRWLPNMGKLVVDTTRTATPADYIAYTPEKNTHPAGTVAMSYLHTEITAWLGAKQVTGYNIGGLTCIGMDDLAGTFATNYVWDGAAGALRLYTQP